MRILVFGLFAILAACTKQNPKACCTDAVDCTNVGLPVGTNCDEGELCRGNRCLEKTCNSTSECDATAPYCVKTDEGRCSESCTADSQCPGLGQAADDTFCVGGACAQCRQGMNDCPVEAPLCSPTGECVTCVVHEDCASGVCASGGCVAENQVAYVATNGSPTSDCTPAAPCSTVDRALAVGRQFIIVAAGTYSSTAAIAPTGVRWIIGKGGRPVFTRTTDGPIFVVNGTVDVKLERLEVFGAKGTTTGPRGYGIECGGAGGGTGSPKLELLDMLVHLNVDSGLRAGRCDLKATASEFSDNMTYGVEAGEGSAVYDRVIVRGNVGTGMFLDEGIHVVTNSIISRNGERGIDIYSSSVGNRIEFNTIVDNGHGSVTGTGLQCGLITANSTHPNNIFARNAPTQVQGTCTYPNSITADDLTPIMFKNPDSAPYDYHLKPGSSAVDLAGASTLKVDIDGEARPFGAGNDLGADELH